MQTLSLLGIALLSLAAAACSDNGRAARTTGGASGSAATGGSSAAGGANSGATGGSPPGSGGLSGSGGGGGSGATAGSAGSEAAGGGAGAGPTGGSGLLSGCTVSANDQPSCSTPAGWTLVTAQGFESGHLPSDQTIEGSIESGTAHAGTHAMYGTYDGDDTEAFWELAQGVAASREVYVSWWEYEESRGRFNDEMFLMRPYLDDATGNLLQEDIIDWFGWGTSSHGGFNASDSIVVVEPQTNSTGLTSIYYGQKATSLPWGSWTQWEVHWKANDPGASNGAAAVYMNGSIIDQWKDKNFNASIDMTAQAIRIGGVYTKLTWWDGKGAFSPPGSCTAHIGDGTAEGAPRVPDFTQPCPCANQCPPNAHVPVFKRYLDDIIVLRK